ETGVCTRSTGQLGIDTGSKNGQPGEAARGQRHGFDLGSIQNVTIRRIDCIEQGIHVDGDRIGHGAKSKMAGQRYGAIRLDENSWNLFYRKALTGKGDGIGTNRQIDQRVSALYTALCCTDELGVVRDGFDFNVRHSAARRVEDGSGDSPKC